MKYLKTYEEVISEENKDTIEDIIIDIKDLGIEVDINRDIVYYLTSKKFNGDTKRKGISLLLEDPIHLITPFEIKDTLQRLKVYASSIGCDMHIDPEEKSMEFLTLKEFMDIYGYDELSKLDIIIFERINIKNESMDDHLRHREEITKLDNRLNWKMEDYEKEVSPIIDMVQDIMVELGDENWDDSKNRFRVNVKAVGPLRDKNDKLRISINIHRETGFIRRDVYPTLDRVDEYLMSEGYVKVGSDIFDGYNCNILYRGR